MIAALIILVFAVTVLGWLLAAIAFVASLTSIVPRMVDHPDPSLEGGASPRSRWRAGDGSAAMMPPGMRAVAVAVNPVVGAVGFTVPGMHVDVLISGTPPGGAGGVGTQTRTLLSNLEVLSACQDFKKEAKGKPVTVQVVNLLVTPKQAEELGSPATRRLST